jgi:hypothetical protein
VRSCLFNLKQDIPTVRWNAVIGRVESWFHLALCLLLVHLNM